MPCQNITLNPLISQTAVRNTCQVTNVKFEGGRVVGWIALKYVLICRSRVPLFTCGYTRESLQHYYTGLLHNWSSCVRYFLCTIRSFHITRGFLDRHHTTFLDRHHTTFLDRHHTTFLDRHRTTFLDRHRTTFLDRHHTTLKQKLA